MKFENKSDKNKWINLYLLIAASLLTYFAILNLQEFKIIITKLFQYLSPFITGFIIAYLLDIPSSFLENWFLKSKNKRIVRRARGISVFLVYIAFVVSITFILSIIIPEIVENTKELFSQLPNYLNNLKDLLKDLSSKNSFIKDDFSKNIEDALEFQNVVSLFRVGNINFDSFFGLLSSIVSVSSYVFGGFLAFISSLYILLDIHNMKRFGRRVLLALFSDRKINIIKKYVSIINKNFRTYLYCVVVDGIVIGTITGIGLSFMGMNYALVLGFVQGIANMIPYFGAIGGAFLLFFVALITKGFVSALMVLGFCLVLQQIDGNIIQPKFFGDSFHISPFVVIVSITIGGIYYGIFGMVIAIPVAATINTIIQDIIDYLINKKKTKICEF